MHAHLDESLWHRPEVVVGAGERPWAVCEADGAALHYTPHDFRRIFITDIVDVVLPNPSCGEDRWPQQHRSNARLHRGLPEGRVRRLRALHRQPATRSPVRRVPRTTQTEWDEFIEHFGQRKIALGNCHRPYGSDCAYEHACIRCDFCQIDPSQSGRLDEIRDNLRLQAEEAQRNRWLGDVAQLRLTIQHADRKAEKLMVRSRGNPELVVAESAGRNADFVGFSDVAAKPAWHRVYGINRRLCRVDGPWASLGGVGERRLATQFRCARPFRRGCLGGRRGSTRE